MNSRKLWWPLAVNDQNQQEMFFRWVGKRWLLTGESARTRKTERWWTNWPADCFASTGTGIRTCGLWKAHQVNVIRHQRILQLNKDGHKSIFLQFYRCYINISTAELTLRSAFHKGKPAILGWKKILWWKCQNIFLSPIAELVISNQMTFHPQFLEETNLKFDFKRTFISCSAAANENIAPNKLPAIRAALLLCPRTML